MIFRTLLMCARMTLDIPSRWRSYWQRQAAHYAHRSEALWLAYMPLLLAKCPHTPRTFIDSGQPLACLECSGPEHVPGLLGLRIAVLFRIATLCAHLGHDRFVDNADRRAERGAARLSTTWMLLLSVVLGTAAWVVIWAVIGGAIASDLSDVANLI